MEDLHVIGKECKFAIYVPDPQSENDYHLVKERLHYNDGSTERKIHYIKNFKRPFYVTRKAFRNHTQKKEYEHLDKLERFESTESQLGLNIAKALDQMYGSPRLHTLKNSPYLYGADLSSTTLIKKGYQKKYPDLISDYDIAYFDIETDTRFGSGDPILATVLFKKVVYCYFLDTVVGKLKASVDDANKAIDTYLSFYRENGYKFHVTFLKSPVELIKASIAKLHELIPDFVAIWNIGFDIPRCIDTLVKYGEDPVQVFSDPKLPDKLKFCKYKKGAVMKTSSSGVTTNLAPSQQWHTLHIPAGFFFIDAMSSYRFIRVGAQAEQSYSLENILKVNGLEGKMKFAGDSNVPSGTLDWHTYMQEKYPYEYMCYNMVDVIRMEELENKTKDLSQSLPILCGSSDFGNFNKQSKKLTDQFSSYLEEHGFIIGTLGAKEEKVELDEDSEPEDQVLSLDEWIVNLPSHMSVLGLPLLLEDKKTPTQIRAFVYDADAVSAYPSATEVANISKATTHKELIGMDIPEHIFRMNNIDLLQGHVNALQYCNQMFSLPNPQDLKYLLT